MNSWVYKYLQEKLSELEPEVLMDFIDYEALSELIDLEFFDKINQHSELLAQVIDLEELASYINLEALATEIIKQQENGGE